MKTTANKNSNTGTKAKPAEKDAAKTTGKGPAKTEKPRNNAGKNLNSPAAKTSESLKNPAAKAAGGGNNPSSAKKANKTSRTSSQNGSKNATKNNANNGSKSNSNNGAQPKSQQNTQPTTPPKAQPNGGNAAGGQNALSGGNAAGAGLTAALKGTRTEENLMAAFAAESQARNKYTFFGDKAKSEGFGEISEIFVDSADNERAHALIWYKLLHDGIAPTEDNLLTAAEGEHYEFAEMYSRFAREARAEGFPDVASLFERVGNIERDHEMRYRALLDNVRSGRVFSREVEVEWRCANCGHVVRGTSAPATCPVCAHAQAFFAVKSESY